MSQIGWIMQQNCEIQSIKIEDFWIENQFSVRKFEMKDVDLPGNFFLL